MEQRHETKKVFANRIYYTAIVLYIHVVKCICNLQQHGHLNSNDPSLAMLTDFVCEKFGCLKKRKQRHISKSIFYHTQ